MTSSRFTRFVRNERGSVAVLTAVAFAVLMGVAALGVDVGKLFLDRRKAQSVADLAALSAASDLANAEQAARATAARNRHGDDAPLEVALGIYTADARVPVRERFQQGPAAGANAARVTLRTASPLFFGRAFLGTDSVPITARATAATTALASFAIGSRLLALNDGVLNQILGGLLGSNLSLSVMDYEALASARINLFDFLGAAAMRANITGPTYDSILSGSLRVGDLVSAMADSHKAAAGFDTAARALGHVSTALNGLPTRLPVASLINLGPYSVLPVGASPQAGLEVGALDMLTAIAQIANGQRQVQVDLQLGVPGLLGASLKLAIGERPVGTSWTTVGAAGASVHTAQTRLLVKAQLAGAGSVASVTLPLYVEIASASATLEQVSCRYNAPASSSVVLRARPAVVDAWIGDVSLAEFNNFRSPPNPPAARLVDTALLRVMGRAHATVTNLSDISLAFSRSDISGQVKKTISTHDFLASLLTRLTQDLSLNVTLLGLGLGLPSGISQLVGGIVANAVSPLDQLLSAVLTAAGIGLGQADVWATGLRCDGSVLVH